MTTMANLTVKKADGTTDIVYTAMTPSAGDSVPAVWRATSVSSTPMGQPELRLTTKSNGARTARQVKVEYSYPIVETNAFDNSSAVRRVNFKVEGSLDQFIAQATLDEAAYQFGNLMAAALVKASVASGFAPT